MHIRVRAYNTVATFIGCDLNDREIVGCGLSKASATRMNSLILIDLPLNFHPAAARASANMH